MHKPVFSELNRLNEGLERFISENAYSTSEIIRFGKQARRAQSESPVYFPKKRKRRANKAKRKGR